MTNSAARAGMAWLVLMAGALGCMSKGDLGTAKAECSPACGANQVCHPTLATCVDCSANGDCAKRNDGAQPFCDLSTMACVECRTKADCQDPTAPVCDLGSCVQKSDNHGGGGGSDDNQAGAGGRHGDTAGVGDT